MSILCWSKQKDYLSSCLPDFKKEHITSINKFVKKFNTDDITNNFYFFITHSFFSPECKFTDIDIVLIPKNKIEPKILFNLNIFFKQVEEFNNHLSVVRKTFDVQAWDLNLDDFLNQYNFNKQILFGNVFIKYSGENVSTMPGVEQIYENLFKRKSEMFTQKHFDRQSNNIVYLSPVTLFEIDSIDFDKYITDEEKIMLFDRIVNTNNFPLSCELCKRINTGYIHELASLVSKGCTSCQMRTLRNKYLKAFTQSFIKNNK
jgi:hypothetical protein